jgi:dTDP-glucose 4,6-dehydratase
MNLLVTGGAGFLGSHFVRGALTGALPGLADARVTVLDKLAHTGGFANLGPVAEHKNLDFVPGDCGDAALLDVILPRHDTVVHFAVTGTEVLLEAALRHGTARFVQVSTDQVYGSIDTGAWTERSPLTPTSPHAAGQAGADLMALAYHRTHALPVVVTRSVDNYGPHQFPGEPVPALVTNLLAGRTVPLTGGGRRTREWVHVEDHCRGVALALLEGAAGSVYHIGGRALTDRDLTGLVLTACGADWERVVETEGGEALDRRRALDDEKIRQELGYRPRWDFEAGLAATVQWYRDNEDWWRPQITD